MRYILPGVEIRMGLPAFQEMEELFPVPHAGAASGDGGNTSLEDQVRAAERELLRNRTQSVEARTTLREKATTVLSVCSKKQIIEYRVDLVRHIQSIERLFDDATRVLEAQATEIEEIGRSFPPGSSQRHHHGRTMIKRMAAAARGQIEYRQQYRAFLTDELLPLVDNQLRAKAATPVSFNDAVEDAFDRYPTIIEYLGR